MTEHDVKILPEYFWAVVRLEKPFEVRENDRDYKKDDMLNMKEWSPDKGYTGNSVTVKVIYFLEGGKFGIEEGYCVMGTKVVSRNIKNGMPSGI